LILIKKINTPREYETTPPRGHSLDRFAAVAIVVIEQFSKVKVPKEVISKHTIEMLNFCLSGALSLRCGAVESTSCVSAER